MTPEVCNVSLVLHHWTQGETKLYDALIEALNDPRLQATDLVLILQSMRGCVTQLDRTHEVLVGSLMNVNWPNQEESVIKEYRSFLLNLLSAHTFYLRAGLRMLVKHFLPDSSENGPDAETKALEDKKFINIHLVLRAVSSLIPMTWTVLMPLLSSCCPFILRPLYQLQCFFTNLLQIPAYMPSLRQPILELIVSRLVQLDVRSPRCEIELRERNKQEVDQVMFEMEVPSNCQGDNKPDASELVEAERLDVLMELLLKYIRDTAYKNDVCDWDSCKKLYRELLLVFERMVLPTCATSHSQFFMFYICSFKPALADGFIDYLWTRFQNPNSETVFRQTSVAYIGSFISRAKFISVKTLKTCIELMVEWVHRYLEQLSAETVFADISHHAPFYSVCQAIFYAFCFRSKDILDSEKGYKWAEGLHLQKIVTCRLNPLRSCLPLVVETFSSVTRIYQLAFCDTIIEKNKRCTIPVSTQNKDGFAVQTEILESFFPFDPYLLNRSGELIRPLYREYTGGAVSTLHGNHDMQTEDDDFLTEMENKADTLGSSVDTWGKSDVQALGTIVDCLMSQEVQSLDVDDEVIQALGAVELAKSADVMVAYLNRTAADITTLSDETLGDMGSMICGFSSSQIGDMQQAAVSEAAKDLSTVKCMDTAQLTAMGNKIVAVEGSDWSSKDTALVGEYGVFAGGLPQNTLSTFTNEHIKEIDPLAIAAIPPATMANAFTADGLAQLTTEQSNAVSDLQKQQLSATQKSSIEAAASFNEVLSIVDTLNPNSGASLRHLSLVLATITSAAVIAFTW